MILVHSLRARLRSAVVFPSHPFMLCISTDCKVTLKWLTTSLWPLSPFPSCFVCTCSFIFLVFLCFSSASLILHVMDLVTKSSHALALHFPPWEVSSSLDVLIVFSLLVKSETLWIDSRDGVRPLFDWLLRLRVRVIDTSYVTPFANWLVIDPRLLLLFLVRLWIWHLLVWSIILFHGRSVILMWSWGFLDPFFVLHGFSLICYKWRSVRVIFPSSSSLWRLCSSSCDTLVRYYLDWNLMAPEIPWFDK